MIFEFSGMKMHFVSQGKAAAARSQGKHKQRVWVNISLSGITITEEKTGVSHLCHAISVYFLTFKR